MSDIKNNQQQTAKRQAPAGFERVVLDMPVFKPELYAKRREGTEIEDYDGLPLQGAIVECRNFGPMKDADGNVTTDENGEIRDQRALVVELEEPLKVQGRDKSQPAIQAKAGDLVLFFATTKIAQAIVAVTKPPSSLGHLGLFEKMELACNDSHGMLRLWVNPTTRTKHPTKAKFRIWNYDVAALVVERPAKHAIASGFFAEHRLAAPAATAIVNPRTEHVLPGAKNGQAQAG